MFLSEARLGAAKYLIWVFGTLCCYCLFIIGARQLLYKPGYINIHALTTIIVIAGIPLSRVFYKASRLRLQDLNMPGGWAYWLFIPIIGVIALPVLCFLSGPRWENEFGDPPVPSNFFVRLAGISCFVGGIYALLAVVNVYSGSQSLHYYFLW